MVQLLLENGAGVREETSSSDEARWISDSSFGLNRVQISRSEF